MIVVSMAVTVVVAVKMITPADAGKLGFGEKVRGWLEAVIFCLLTRAFAAVGARSVGMIVGSASALRADAGAVGGARGTAVTALAVGKARAAVSAFRTGTGVSTSHGVF